MSCIMLSTPKAKAELFLASSLYDGLEDNNIIQVTTLLLNKEADPNILIPSQGITPFHLVIGNDSETFAEEVTKLFLRHGGNPNVKSTDGLTPVHVAAAWGRLGVLELLLSNGGDPLLVDNDGRCPFHYAFDEAHYDAVAILGKYCGESFDEYPDPKYNLALEKILVTEGDVVAEYAVSEDTCAATATCDVPAIETKNILDNNSNFLENLNQSFAPGKKVENNALKPECDFSRNANLAVTTSAEESSIPSTDSVSFDQNRKFLLCGNPMHGGKEFHKNGHSSAKLNSEMKKIPPEIVGDCLFFSGRNNPVIEDLVLIAPQQVDDSMPHVNLPKTVKELNKQRYESRMKRQNVGSLKITSQVPEKYLNKAKTIITPNILMRPKSPKKSAKPVINRKLQEIRTTSADGTSPGKGINSKNTDSYRTLPLDRYFRNDRSSMKYFCKTEQLVPEFSDPKKNPTSSLKRFHDLPIKADEFILIRNFTDSIKQNRKLTISRSQPKLTPSCSRGIFSNYALNKTYNADIFNLTIDSLSELSLGDKIGKFFVDSRVLSEKTAFNSEESMYDDSRDSRVTDVQRVSHDVAHVKDEVNVPVKSVKSPTGADLRISGITDEYSKNSGSNYTEMSINFRHISKVNQTTGSSNMNNDTNSIGRFSNVITGFLQRGDYCSCVKTIETKIASDSIGCRLPRPHSRLLTRNSVTSNLVNSVDPEMPKSREINNSLESYDLSDHSTDRYTWDIASDGLSIKSNKLLVSGSIHDNSINHESFVSIEEEYKYEDVEEGVILLERRLLTTPVSIPLIKTENEVSLSGTGGGRIEDESLESRLSSLPRSLVVMDGETLRRELTKLDRCPPGPITATTRHVYLRRLRKLQKCGPTPASTVTIAVPPKFSAEIERTLRSEDWISDLSQHEALELQVFGEFSNPDPTRRWREGINKSSFNYLLMDPRITKNLPRRGSDLSLTERWRIFLSAIFYIGKGKRSRPYSHLYAAYEEWKKGKRTTNDEKISCILDIWQSDCGVVCLHLFQNAIPVEAYTREAAMIDALGLDRLKNSKSGNYYGVAATWSNHQKRMLGVYLLYKAMHILMHEGERQLSPESIER